MRVKSARAIRAEAWAAAAIQRLPLYRMLPETWRAAFDLRREFFRANQVYVRRLQQAVVGMASAGISFVAGGLLPDAAGPLAIVGWVLGAVSLIGALATLYTAGKPDRNKADDQFSHRCEKLRDLCIGGANVPFDAVVPERSDTLADLTIARSPLSGDAFERSPTFDDALTAMSTLPFRPCEDRSGTFYLADAHARDRQLDYLRYRIEEKRRTTNDAKFGLAFRFEHPIGPVDLFRIGYYDSLVTNEAFRSRIARRHKGDNAKTVEPSHVERLDANFPVEAGRLLPLTVAATANHVGITTLAISADGYPLVFRQVDAANIGAGCAVLAGSGSVDFDDVAAADDPADLKSILRHAMARELHQEVLLAHDGGTLAETRGEREARLRAYRERTIVTGFFRWVNRCGKPEFVGITVIPALRRTLAPNPLEVSPIADVEQPHLALPRLERLADLDRVAGAVQAWIDGHPAQRSVSLSSAVALIRAAEIARSDPASPAFRAVDRLLESAVKDWKPSRQD